MSGIAHDGSGQLEGKGPTQHGGIATGPFPFGGLIYKVDRNKQVEGRIQKEITPRGQEEYDKGEIPDPTMIDSNGKPFLDTSHHQRFVVSEKDMTDVQKMAWKNFQLWKTTLKIDRRDTVLEALTSADYPNARMSHHWLGTPFPVVEPNPHISEVFMALRWYEHAFSALFAVLYFQWIRSKPALRFSSVNWFSTKWVCTFSFVIMEFNFGYRAIWRLQGQCPNDPECYKYGVVETPHRLKVKAERWRKFKNYKDEWMRRWDYYMWGQRPGEQYSFFSACWMGPWPVRFNTKTDFPVRKNPFRLGSTGIRERNLDGGLTVYYPPNDNTYLTRSRPELNYIYRGGIG